MADSIVDFAGLDSVMTTEAPVETAATETTEAVETPTTGDETTTTETTEVDSVEKNADGTEKEKTDTAEVDKNSPDSVRKFLKGIRDLDPKNAAFVKTLHNSYERFNAYTKEFPTVNDAREAKAFIESVGGPEGFEKTQQVIQSIEESDQLLYAGDGKLIDNIVEDLKSEGKLDAFTKLASPFLDKLQSLDETGYKSVVRPHLLSNLEKAHFPGAVAGLLDALNKGGEEGIAEALRFATSMDAWYKGQQGLVEKDKSASSDPGFQKLEAERKKFQEEKNQFKTNQGKEFQTTVAKELDSHNNRTLGTQLKDYLKHPYFKGFPRPSLEDLAGGIKANLFRTLEADKAYQTQMKALWGASSPDRAKISQYHKAKVDSIAAKVVQQTIQQRYPNYAKGGSAAGRIAATDTKKAEQVKTEAAATTAGKPIYVAEKPKWDSINWDKDPQKMLFITGKAYLKGNNKFVTWRKP